MLIHKQYKIYTQQIYIKMAGETEKWLGITSYQPSLAAQHPDLIIVGGIQHLHDSDCDIITKLHNASYHITFQRKPFTAFKIMSSQRSSME